MHGAWVEREDGGYAQRTNQYVPRNGEGEAACRGVRRASRRTVRRTTRHTDAKAGGRRKRGGRADGTKWELLGRGMRAGRASAACSEAPPASDSSGALTLSVWKKAVSPLRAAFQKREAGGMQDENNSCAVRL